MCGVETADLERGPEGGGDGRHAVRAQMSGTVPTHHQSDINTIQAECTPII